MRDCSIIVAVAENGVIGNGLEIPWHISDEFKHFKATTTGGIIVFGRRTWESIGRPLPNRENVVITSSKIEGVECFTSLEDALEHYKNDTRKFWVCGGAKLYAHAINLPSCKEMILSRIKMSPAGDIFFPPFGDVFKLEKVEDFHAQFTVETWRRI